MDFLPAGATVHATVSREPGPNASIPQEGWGTQHT
jgi:hypothetical protein